MSKSLCKGKRTSQPNRCKKVKGCKVANGTKRTFCRKRHNKTRKNKKSSKVSGGTPRTRHAHYLENVARYRKEHPPTSPKKPKVSTTKSMTTRSHSNSSK